jgi:hypothetical protein
MPLAAGARLGPYEIVDLLGAGGMGEVYRARDTRPDRTVAVKVLPETLAVDEASRARFAREAKAISSLNHPHICGLYDIGRDHDTEYLVLELLEGETLAARLQRGALPFTHVLTIGADIADGLGAAHRLGIVHRDLALQMRGMQAQVSGAVTGLDTAAGARRARGWLPWSVVTLAAAAAGAVVTAALLLPRSPMPIEAPRARFDVTLPATMRMGELVGPSISPDGRWVVYPAATNGQPQLFRTDLSTGGDAADRHRRRVGAVLVAQQPNDRVLHRDLVATSAGDRRADSHLGTGPERPRGVMG